MRLFPVLLLGSVCALSACAWLQPGGAAARKVDFVTQVKPLLESRCLECHQDTYVCAGLNLETRQKAMKGGRAGPVILPGNPEGSLLYRVLFLGHDNPVAMPPTPERVEKEDLKTLHDWIAQGAVWPDGVRLVPPQEWASTGR
ncbi:MAG: hypothetical protein HS117_22575 [Verrucomicrobiaceae bacterium]|jgi:hypothetical protein|nr:hypothetical protein [Verrucomicrobiaceae bacterium]